MLGYNGDFPSYNLFTYCGNNPVIRKDIAGYGWETVFDVISLGVSISDVVNNPHDGWAWAGLVGDVIDVVVPFLAGTGESVKALRVSIKFTADFGDLSRATEFGINTYKALKKALKGSGLQAHHIIEKRLLSRFYKQLGMDLGDILSVAVTPYEHQKFTNKWRKLIPYGANYRDITVEEIWTAAQEVYADYPKLLDAAYKVLFG